MRPPRHSVHSAGLRAATFLLCAASVSHAAVYQGFTQNFVGYCFIDAKARTYDEAESFCRTTLGTGLAIVDTQNRYTQVKSLMTASGNCSWDTWISGKFNVSQEQWIWPETGSTVTWNKWNEGYPTSIDLANSSDFDNSSEVDSYYEDEPLCMQVMHPIWWGWQNTRCGERKKQWICEVSSVRKASSAYHTAIRVLDSMLWDRAQEVCETHMGTDLASFRSYNDLSLLNNALHNSGHWSDSVSNYFHWGINDRDFDTNWTNVDGTRNDYQRWVSGQPYATPTLLCSTNLWYRWSDAGIDQYASSQLYQRMSSCSSFSLTNLICNNENLYWSMQENMVLVQRPTSEVTFEGVNVRDDLQEGWTATQSQSYCSSRMNRNLVSILDLNLYEEYTDMLDMHDTKYMSRIWNESRMNGQIIGAWIGLRFVESTKQWTWVDSGITMDPLFEDDQYWVYGFNDSINNSDLSADLCVYADLNAENEGDSFGKWVLTDCESVLDHMICASTFQRQSTSTGKYNVKKRKAGKMNRQQYRWISTPGNGTMSWQKATDICFSEYGTHLGSLHTNSSARVVMRGRGGSSNRLQAFQGWIGLKGYQSAENGPQWRWSDGSPYNGLELFSWYSPKLETTTEMCAMESSDLTYWYGWQWVSCGNAYTYALCSAVTERWSRRLNDNGTVYTGYRDSKTNSRNKPERPKNRALSKFVLLESKDFSIRYRRLRSWCQKRFNLHAGSIESYLDWLELQQLLIDQNLLYSPNQGGGQIVWIGGKYDNNYQEWFWDSGKKINLKKIGKEWNVTLGKIKNQKRQCLVIDTKNGQWKSVSCLSERKYWVCNAPRLYRFKHHFRTPMRGKFCVVPWLYALLTAIFVTLNVGCHWWSIRVIQWEAYEDSTDENTLANIFDNPMSSSVNKRHNNRGMMSVPQSSNDEFFRVFVDDLLIRNWDLPSGLCGMIHEFVGKPTVGSYVKMQAEKWRLLIDFCRRYVIWAIPILKTGFNLMTSAILFWWYVEFALDRKSSWQEFGGFWWIWMIHPTSMKFVVHNSESAKIERFYNHCVRVNRAIWSSNYEDVLLMDFVIAVMIFFTSAGLWCCSAFIGIFTWPWLCIFPTFAMIWADQFYDNDEMDCVDQINDLADKCKVDINDLRKMNWKSFRRNLFGTFIHACVMMLTWLFLAVGGIAFWALCTGRNYIGSHSDAWSNYTCDTAFDFDAYDWRAWMLLIHWVFF